MLKGIEKTSTKLPTKLPGKLLGKKASTHKALLKLSGDDFLRNEDGFWVATKDIFITGATENQLLIKAGREFKKGNLAIVGLDLAAVLEKHCPQ
ncbi:MAG: hypothetical protein HQ475_04780 [SAR202 cluster bacterium]|nr:hypothetical protein [SAR202 cluster bacterium]